MFCNTSKYELRQALERNDKLAKRIQELEEQIINERKVHEAQLKDLRDGDVATSNMALDWSACNAFAIERNQRDGQACTIVGHIIKEPVAFTDGQVQLKDVVREWYMYCSHDEHQRLVKDFEAYKKGKK